MRDIEPRHESTVLAVTTGCQRVEALFERHLDSDLPPVRGLVQHVERYRGKMLRPAIAFTCGIAAHRSASDPQACLSQSHEVVAAVVEMVHMATLVHDDVLDEADMRRRGATVNNLHGNEVAVILGDHLIASAYELCSSLESPEPARIVGRASVVTCSGELLQLHHRGNYSIDEQTYYEVVQRKTGELIAAAAHLGAWCSGAPMNVRSALREYALELGIAFQVQDDLLDLTGEERVVGKSVRKDLHNGKLTLPLIHHLREASPADRARTIHLLDAVQRENESGAGAELLAAAERTDSLDYARNAARLRVEHASSLLETLPDSPAKELLLVMGEMVVQRAF